MAAPAALAGGSFVLLAVIVVLLVAVVWGYYTKTGSDITPRPSDGLGGAHEAAAPGAEGRGRIAGKVDGEQDRFDTHGTQ